MSSARSMGPEEAGRSYPSDELHVGGRELTGQAYVMCRTVASVRTCMRGPVCSKRLWIRVVRPPGERTMRLLGGCQVRFPGAQARGREGRKAAAGCKVSPSGVLSE
jgi:hypothetical protein